MDKTMSKENNDCSICTEKFNNTKRKEVKCISCNYSSCRECLERYLLNTFQQPHCSNCRVRWEKNFLYSSFTKVFVDKKLRLHQEDMIFLEEKTYLPLAQREIEKIRNLEKIREEMGGLVQKLRETDDELYNLKELKLGETSEKIIDEIDTQLEIYKSIRNEYSSELFQKKCDYNNLKYSERHDVSEKREEVVKCPEDGCEGFLNKGECGLCHSVICKKCWKSKDKSSHTCLESDIETYEFILKGSKPCPKCGVRIMKSEGCDQMFCINCHTPFSWKTGKIENGLVHNPHYFEWMRKNGEMKRQQGDGCDILPQYISLQGNFSTFQTNFRENINDVLREAVHYRAKRVPVKRSNLDCGVKFLLREIDEKEFKRRLFINERNYREDLEIYEIYRTYSLIMTDLFGKLTNLQYSEEKKDDTALSLLKTELISIVSQMETAKVFINNSLKTLSKMYRNKAVEFIRCVGDDYFIIADDLRIKYILFDIDNIPHKKNICCYNSESEESEESEMDYEDHLNLTVDRMELD